MNTRRKALSALAALASLALTPAARAHTGARLRIVTAHLPPLVLEHGGDRPGALFELVQELCRRLQLAPATEFVPWPRALFLAGASQATAIFPLTRQPDREARFRWLAPLYDENYVFLAPRQGRFDLRHPEAMTTRRITLIRGAAQGAVLRELGYRRLVEANSIEEVHRFLLGGMADAAFGERNIIKTSLRTRGAENDFSISAPVHSTTAWLAGSLDFGDDEVRQFGAAMAAMKADGTARRILSRYGLE
ncbi:MAG: transporter substrate-binding domain-containing protein [Burkholderiaceae bacterium]|nr:transporter substrate-binding domain-containing protein [Burkholderiaceae bacterium]